MTSVGNELGEMVRMLERLPAGELDRLLLDLGGAPRVGREVAA